MTLPNINASAASTSFVFRYMRPSAMIAAGTMLLKFSTSSVGWPMFKRGEVSEERTLLRCSWPELYKETFD